MKIAARYHVAVMNYTYYVQPYRILGCPPSIINYLIVYSQSYSVRYIVFIGNISAHENRVVPINDKSVEAQNTSCGVFLSFVVLVLCVVNGFCITVRLNVTTGKLRYRQAQFYSKFCIETSLEGISEAVVINFDPRAVSDAVSQTM